MKHKCRARAFIALIAIASSFTAQRANAEEHNAPFTMDALLVSASLLPETLRASGSAVSIITRQDITRSGETFLIDILRKVPSVAISQSGGAGSLASIRIRGGESDHTLLLINGVEYNSPLGGGYDFAHLLAEDVERIEVIRGAQSAVHGADALAGVISIFTRQYPTPQGQDSTSHLTIEGGSFSSLLLSGGGSMKRQNHSAFLSWNIADTDNIDISANDGRYERDPYQRWAVHAGYGWERSGVRLKAQIRHAAARGHQDAYDSSANPNRVSDAFGDIDERYEETALLLQMLHAREAGYLGKYENALHLSRLGTRRDVLTTRREAADSRDIIRSSRLALKGQTSLLSQNGGVTALLGWEEESFNQNDRPQESANKVFVAAEGNLALANRYFATLGMRYEDNSRFRSSFTWRFTTALYAGDALPLRFHASYGTSVQNPSLYDLFGFTAAFFTPNPRLEAEEGESFDLGVSLLLAEPSLTLDITYFESALDNEITFQFGEPGTPSLFNARGESDRRGVEMSLAWRVLPTLTLQGRYAYVSSEQPNGAKEIRRPENLFGASLEWQPSERWTISASWDYTDDQQDLVFLPAPDFGSRDVRLGNYTLLSLKASYRIRSGLLAYLRAENALDESYEDVAGYATRGLGVYAGFRANF